MKKSLSILLLITTTMLAGCTSKKVHVHTQDRVPTNTKKSNSSVEGVESIPNNPNSKYGSCKDCLPHSTWYAE